MVWRTAHRWLSRGGIPGARDIVGRAFSLVAVCAVTLATASCGGDDKVTASYDEVVRFAQQPGLHAQYLDSRAMPYALAIPTDYSASVDVPLVVALHWDGEVTPYIGGEFLNSVVGPAIGDLNAIFVAPDAVSGDWANTTAETDLIALIDSMKTHYSIASGKTIIVGYSMGGAGVWYMVERHPERFAGGIAMAAPSPANVLDISWEVPLFLIHSVNDEVVAFNETATVYEDLHEKGLDVSMFAITGPGHYDVSGYVSPLATTASWIETLWE